MYRLAPTTYFFNDDLHWLVDSFRFEPSYVWRIDQHSHFYRPLIAFYFWAGLQLVGCAPVPFHVASVVVHLLTTGAVYLLAAGVSRRPAYGALAAMLFAVQPGFVEAVIWVGAITDLMPALFYVTALWLHLRVVEGAGRATYLASLAVFVACLLTHESSATLLPMLLGLEWLLHAEGRVAADERTLGSRLRRYAPFVALLAGYLAIEYVVNTRSYVVTDGYYALGAHLATNALRYVRWMIVWRPGPVSASIILVGVVALLAVGRPRVRFAVAWMAVAMAPVLPFTWGTASRYLYLPAVGFCLLQADGALWLFDRLALRWSRRAAVAVVAVVVAVVGLRAATFAGRGVAEFHDQALPYGTFMAAVRARYPVRPADGLVDVTGIDHGAIPAIYVDSAVKVEFCDTTVRIR